MNTLESSRAAPVLPGRSAAVTLFQSVEVKLLLLSTIPPNIVRTIFALSFCLLFLLFTPPGDNCPFVLAHPFVPPLVTPPTIRHPVVTSSHESRWLTCHIS